MCLDIRRLRIVLLSLAVVSSASGQGYNYDNPSEWNNEYETCRGNRQSPIDLFRSQAINETNLPRLSFNEYNIPITMPVEAINNGHTVHVDVNNVVDGNRPSVTGGGVNETYEAQSFHFHWGSQDSKGSEHEINKKKYDVELHIVHKNVKFANLTEASKDPSGILVLGIMLKKWQFVPTPRTGLNEVYDVLPELSKYNSRKALNHSITMDSILSGLNTRHFYTYQGSLTTPPCSEAVTWFVFPDVVPIQSRYLKRFWNLYDSRNVPLLNNFRPIQNTEGRDVFYREGKQAQKR
ncbi:carbonic anhydrase 7-like [Episyrphus balteatus]|uniref:carbonic anhydrase 7-like n=1 Tax=Episyrphus balteatus TaxID=286459 RepID=UPI0024868ED8|nr:carbonic anhydrase 7-like [Episyrphus balteatus]